MHGNLSILLGFILLGFAGATTAWLLAAALVFIYAVVPAALILGFLGLLFSELIKEDLTYRRRRASL